MRNFEKHFKNFGGFTLVVIFFSLFLQGCLQSPKAKKSSIKSSASTTDTTAKVPTFTSGNNFIQNGSDIFTSTANLEMSFSDSLQLRGKDVDSYIRNSGLSNVVCLTSKFNQAGVKKVIIMAAVPRSTYIFATQTIEYYFNLTPGDVTTNSSFCQKTGLINKLYDASNVLTPKYTMKEVCPSGTCNNTSYMSQSLELCTSAGLALTQIATKQLYFNVANTTSGGASVGLSCTEAAQCTSQGYDCCSLGQCVTDKALKPGIDTSPANVEYTQALQDILNNPSNIYLYPQFYFICSDTATTTPTTPTTTDPLADAVTRLNHLADLYSCTTKIEGEYGVCSVTHEGVVADMVHSYSANKDDKSFAETFSNTNVMTNTLSAIEQITYGGVLVYDYRTKTDLELSTNDPLNEYVSITGNQNDNLDTGTEIKLKRKPATAVNDNLVIKYKVDASCELVNKNLAKCEKYYVQGQENSGSTPASYRQGRVTDHFPDTNIFKLPYYADTTKAIVVTVDGLVQKVDTDWQLVVNAQKYIQFIPTNTLQVFKDQKVKITYYVNLDTDNVMRSKLAAMEEIKTKCSCGDFRCSLTPVKNSSNSIVDYACVYPEADPVEPPMSQKIYLSSKTVPMRYFDTNGTSQKTINASSLGQEVDGDALFKYTNDNLLTPNNIQQYIGFNEIYGSLSYTNNSAKPAYEVSVKKGTTYDIYVDRGAFSNCVQCGNDYYSQLNKLFPLAQFGGGAVPLLGQTNRTMTTGIRSDDMKFGRACLVPATMLPWSHGLDSSNKTQRLNRMKAQHFYYANGYQNDWYGFDYGAVIGSFDGVKWFAIGSNRRIKAETTKMFLAVNGMFGDLTLESTYEVSINDGSLNPVASNLVTTDYESDGAECQQFHQCSTDNDCATTLGWEYSCAPVGEITTTWPVFDENAKEIPEITKDDNRLTSILGISNSAKRCVYRGRGALCTQNYGAVNINSTFNTSTNQAMHACSQNNYCQPITVNGIPTEKFNNKIVRYGKVRTDSTVDSFGLAALVPGRPFAWNALEKVNSKTLKNLNTNKALAMCVPGRDVEQNSFLEQNRTVPAVGEFNGDKVLGIGMTYRKNTPTAAPNYLNACSIMDTTKNFYQNTTTNPSSLFTSYPNLKLDAGSQAISTNVLNIFTSIFSTKGITFNLYKGNSAILNSVSFTENRCMRAPGSSCFTDMDCGPSKVVTDKIKSLSAADTVVTSILNKYEIKFWQEEMICSQAVAKTSNLYDPKNNRCCRDVGATISLPSADVSNGLDMTKVPGIDYSMGTQNRYSRAATMYKETNLPTPATTPYPELRTAIKDQCALGIGCQSMTTLANQYKTFAAFAEKTSCSGDWVRNFDNGTHKWEPSRLQTFNVKMFQCLNWLPGKSTDTAYSCEGYDLDDPTCPIAQTPPNTIKAKAVFSYLGKLELMGIPQIALESEAFFRQSSEQGFSCKSDPVNKVANYPTNTNFVTPATNYAPPTLLFNSAINPQREYGEPANTADPTKQFYSGIDNTNFQNMKMIFKPDEVVSCLPAGTQMKAGDDAAKCCTGMINSSNLKCQLPDYIDLSVYTNRYVSSEAKKLSATLFDSSGYLKDPSYAAVLACEKQMCASGTIAYGVLISRLKTPGQIDSQIKAYRFLEGSIKEDNEVGLLDAYNKGLKINTHAYCIPKALAQAAAGAGEEDTITVVNCAN